MMSSPHLRLEEPAGWQPQEGIFNRNSDWDRMLPAHSAATPVGLNSRVAAAAAQLRPRFGVSFAAWEDYLQRQTQPLIPQHVRTLAARPIQLPPPSSDGIWALQPHAADLSGLGLATAPETEKDDSGLLILGFFCALVGLAALACYNS